MMRVSKFFLGSCLSLCATLGLPGLSQVPGLSAMPGVSDILGVLDRSAHAQQRQTFTFTRPGKPGNGDPETGTPGNKPDSSTDTSVDPDQSSDQAEPLSNVSSSRILRDVAWFLRADGDWGVDMQGYGQARVTGSGSDAGKLIRVTLEQDQGGPPIRFFVMTSGSELDHVYFTQTGDQPVSAAGIHSPGTNYLSAAGRETDSLRGNDNPGSLANHDGIVRVDQRDEGLLINFSATAVFCETIREGPRLSLPPCGGKYYITSRPGRTGPVKGCIVAVEQLRANPDACLEPFQIDRVTPVEDRENVNFKDPGLEVVFSDRIKASTLDDAFDLFTYSADGTELNIEGDWQQNGPTTYRFVPEEQLYSGTTYIARVEGGRDGVESREGAWLEEPYEWRFSSLLDLDAQGPDDDVPVRLHNYQVIRDGKLTVDKPTLTRAYVTWKPHEEVARDMQPESFRLQFKPSERYGRWVGQRDALPVSDAVRVWRYDDPEQFNDEDRRHAQQTVNFFGWKPRGSGTQTFTVRAHDPWPSSAETIEHKAENEYDVWQHDPGDLDIYYTYALVGEWGSDVPVDVQSHLLRSLFLAEDYVAQYLPYRGASAQFIGNPPSFVDFLISMFRDPATFAAWVTFGQFERLSNDGGSGLAGHFATAIHPVTVAARIQHELAHGQLGSPASNASQILLGAYMRYIQDILSDRISRDDMLVMFIPSRYLPDDTLGRGISDADNPLYHGMMLEFRVRSVVMRIDTGFSADALGVGLVHEFGHTFGLSHNPGNASTLSSYVPHSHESIEGFKIAKDGLDGWNKSTTDGNAQSDDLASLMWPLVLDSTASLITESEYQHVQSEIEKPFQGRSWINDLKQLWPQGYRFFDETYNEPYARWALNSVRSNVASRMAQIPGDALARQQTLSDADPVVNGVSIPGGVTARTESLLLSGAIFGEAGIAMLYPPVRGLYAHPEPGHVLSEEMHTESSPPLSHTSGNVDVSSQDAGDAKPDLQHWVELRTEEGGVRLSMPLLVADEVVRPSGGNQHEWVMPAMPESWRYFRQVLPVSLFEGGDVRSLVIGQGEREIASYPVPGDALNPPEVSLAGDVLSWKRAGDDLRYQVAYRLADKAPHWTQEQPWQTVALQQSGASFDLRELDRRLDSPGTESAEFGVQVRVSATDGFRYADTVVEIPLNYLMV
ncbi:Ig-like domain-containing protein [Orrella marina]|uniref:SbsA Ig-like domain-containing protein n=1 Tax=Orrella marina TaxID=2163011 RepID=A0A2R4XFJ2_9BURK|nr:Ig-like domain-containing protein [Orrella marina]AWB32587.1 hypothetical protein DBV39_01365 [Orrella marina]